MVRGENAIVGIVIFEHEMLGSAVTKNAQSDQSKSTGITMIVASSE